MSDEIDENEEKKGSNMQVVVGASVGVAVFLVATISVTGFVIQRRKRVSFKRKLSSLRERQLSMDVYPAPSDKSDADI